MDSPIEALDARVEAGFTHVIDVPYEFDANSRDTLIVLRQGYQREAPDWNAAWESHFTYRGMQVTIANVNGGDAHKIAALQDVTAAALAGWLPAGGMVSHEHEGAAATHDGHSSATADGDRRDAAMAATPSGGSTHDHLAAPVGFDEIGAASSRGHTDDGDHSATQRDGHEHVAAATGHSQGPGGAGTTTGVLLALFGGGAVVVAVGARHRGLVGRVVLAGLGAQLAGLGWDVLIHADAGEGVHLFENAGHWLALAGLAATAIAVAALWRSPAPAPV